MTTLKPCPCGKTPDYLGITDGDQGKKYHYAMGNCCGEWMIEFHAKYKPIESPECMALAIAAWNASPRPATAPADAALADEWILQAVARGWCHEGNAHKTMDSTLAKAIASEVAAALRVAQPQPVVFTPGPVTNMIDAFNGDAPIPAPYDYDPLASKDHGEAIAEIDRQAQERTRIDFGPDNDGYGEMLKRGEHLRHGVVTKPAPEGMAMMSDSFVAAARRAKTITADVCKAYPETAAAHINGLADLIIAAAKVKP